MRFAADHRGHFEVMFRPELYDAADPAVRGARRASSAALYGSVGDVLGAGHPLDALAPGVAAWSLVHGLATLLLNDNLPAELGRDPEQVTRRVARYLFAGPSARGPHPRSTA
ncbi:MAG TPA: TetR-like C-terminal domain-containing protein [Acidimicrobiales bacterium]|nr:TetR-like C-terminal domain-containing protein [Acidimicrobiales bacterium]